MSASIAESRKQLATLIEAAQKTPQVITKRNQPVAVLVSNEYFEKTQTFVDPNVPSFYERLLEFRRTHVLDDNTGFETTPRAESWNRSNSFAKE